MPDLFACDSPGTDLESGQGSVYDDPTCRCLAPTLGFVNVAGNDVADSYDSRSREEDRVRRAFQCELRRLERDGILSEAETFFLTGCFARCRQRPELYPFLFVNVRRFVAGRGDQWLREAANPP
jgi:hypothetical protein